MKAYWSTTRPNGKPVETGVCYITDLEDGSGPIATYGANEAEVLDKLALQNGHAQLELNRRPRNGAAPHAAPPSPPPARTISADQVMQATVDLKNGEPAKSGAAVATLLESATGISPRQMIIQNFGRLAEEWQQEHPEFYDHPGNVSLVTTLAAQLAGRLAQVTKEHLTMAADQLRREGKLFDAPMTAEPSTQPATHTFPGESQVQRTERPRIARHATAPRSTSFRPQQGAVTRTLKFTEEEILNMPLRKSRELVESNDPDYAAACEHYFGKVASVSGPV